MFNFFLFFPLCFTLGKMFQVIKYKINFLMYLSMFADDCCVYIVSHKIISFPFCALHVCMWQKSFKSFNQLSGKFVFYLNFSCIFFFFSFKWEIKNSTYKHMRVYDVHMWEKVFIFVNKNIFFIFLWKNMSTCQLNFILYLIAFEKRTFGLLNIYMIKSYYQIMLFCYRK